MTVKCPKIFRDLGIRTKERNITESSAFKEIRNKHRKMMTLGSLSNTTRNVLKYKERTFYSMHIYICIYIYMCVCVYKIAETVNDRSL